MNYDQQIEQMYHPENSETETEMIMNTDWDSERRGLLRRFTIDKITNQFWFMDLQESLEAIDENTQKQFAINLI